MTAADYALGDRELLARCTVEAMRAQGPGGQHVNRTESAIRITHPATGAAAQCQDHRERPRNQADALHRLRIRLAAVQRGVSDPAWLVPYRHGGKLQIGPGGGEFHLVAAVLLDALAVADGSLAQAADVCGLSTSQLTRCLVADPDIRAAADRLRAAAGHGPIHAR